MNAATLTMELELQTDIYSKDTIIHFSEGLIGFAGCKDFVLVENDQIRPFRLLQCTESTEIGFLVVEPAIQIPDYYNQIPAQEWEAIGVTNPGKRLAFVIVNIGLNATATTANFQAPLLVNYETMAGRQTILTNFAFSMRHLLSGKRRSA